MTTLLNQALILTLVGMGMTFGALGLLVLGMYAMTALITDKPRRQKPPRAAAPAEETLVTQVADVVLHLATTAARPPLRAEEERELAAVAAVIAALASEDATADARYRAAAAAVAMAVASDAVVQAPTPVFAMPDAWNIHVREQQLAPRQRWVGRR
ncbi:MAG TPA: OadG family protein [Anaerolineae bacterium]|nr:OadG family protein [Anaerolineae bacterium]HQH39570.1 OadG family protein [Anaerolineae bacterium]